MPFKSDKQRKWMWANDPEMAKKWEKEEQKEAVQVNIDKVLKEAIANEEIDVNDALAAEDAVSDEGKDM